MPWRAVQRKGARCRHSREGGNPPTIPMSRHYYVYIPASKPHGTLYIGMTDNLARRTWQHRQGFLQGFTKRYNVHRLVYRESFARPRNAIQREKRLKKWNRAWKIRLIESTNPGWKDLYETVVHTP